VPQSRRPYSRKHLNLEKGLGWLYSGSWPAKLWARVPGATRVTLLRHDVTAPGRAAGRPPLKVAFASDLHLGPTTPRALLDNAFALLREAEPDVLALGGDYVFLGATKQRVEELKARVLGVNARTKVAVLGNHDFWARPERLEDALAQAGVHVLVDESLRLPAPHDDVALVGLDDPLTRMGVSDSLAREADLAAAMDEVRDVPVKIALCHSPDGFRSVRGKGIALYLCGHTHGGHIALPGYRPIVMPSRYGRLWPWGFHEVEGTSLFVSRGVGGSLVPVRTYAPPDVAVFTITGCR
jgi:predicted MPP superfamily phosphohydrolase